jgi:hypothetical protein
MAELTSRQIGKYQIQAELGRGGFGSVYRAYDPTVGRLVAIKVLTASGDQQLLTRFKNEAGAAGNLRHKNIVTIYDFGEFEGLPYIVMEFLEGEDLQQVIAQKKPLPLLQKVSIMLQVADGLQCAHRSGVVHRDVKPGNIRLLPDGTVKIMDFGIARLTAAGGGGPRLTRQGYVIGTLLYMAPEQVRGGEVDFLCDIFAYGITYYELLTGQHPFQGSDPRTVFYRITTEDPEPIRNIVPDCPEALEAIVRRTLQKERELRPQSFREVQLDTEPLLIDLRQDRAQTLLAEATRLYDGGQIDSAQAVLNEAFDLDPANRGARQLRETIQAQLLRRLIEPRIEAMLKQAEGFISERRFAEAIETFEAALRLDRDNPGIVEHLNRARQLQSMSRESARLLAEARREFSRNNLEGVLQTLPETLELDPGNPEARQLLDEVRQELARREKKRAYEKDLQMARDLLSEGRFADALAKLEGLDSEDRERDEVHELNAEIKEKKQAFERQQKFREELEAAREFMQSGQHEAAIRRLERLMNKYPEEPEATKAFIVAYKKLAAQRKNEALEALEKEVARFREVHDFERALERSKEVLREYPAEQRLIETIKRIEAERERWKRSEAAREAIEKAQGYLAQGSPETAEEVLKAALAADPGEGRLTRTLADVRLALETKRRNEAIEALCLNAQDLSAALEFQSALAALDQGRETYGDDARLTGTRESIVRAQAQWEREETVRLALLDFDQHLSANSPEQAIERIEAALTRYPDEDRLTSQLAIARDALAAKRRENAIAGLVRSAGRQLANREFDPALAELEGGLSALGEDSRLTELQARVRTAKADWERSQAIATALEKSRQRSEKNDPEAAVSILEAVLRL